MNIDFLPLMPGDSLSGRHSLNSATLSHAVDRRNDGLLVRQHANQLATKSFRQNMHQRAENEVRALGKANQEVKYETGTAGRPKHICLAINWLIYRLLLSRGKTSDLNERSLYDWTPDGSLTS